MRSGDLVVLRRQDSAGGGAHPEDVEVVSGHELTAHSLRNPTIRKAYAGGYRGRRRDRVTEESIRGAQVLVEAMRIVRGIDIDVSPGCSDGEELFRGLHGQRAEKKDLDEREHGSRRTNAQSEHDENAGRKRSRSQQDPYAVAQVLNQCLQMTREKHADLHQFGPSDHVGIRRRPRTAGGSRRAPRRPAARHRRERTLGSGRLAPQTNTDPHKKGRKPGKLSLKRVDPW